MKRIKKQERFEDHLQELEKVVSDLEKGELDLETSLNKYETGVKALKKCYGILDEMEKKIEILTKHKEGDFQTRPFKPKKIMSTENNNDED